MKFAIVGGCACPAEIAPELVAIQHAIGCGYASIDRSDAAGPLLARLGKHTQRQIYQEWLDGIEPNPANPPGRSTHDHHSDGVPYPGPIGRLLRLWQVGIDVDDAHVPAFIAEAWNAHKWVAFRPYSSGSEFHHVNFRKRPILPLRFLPLKQGQTNRHVGELRKRLDLCGYTAATRANKRHFGPEIESAIKRFQTQHHLTVDGVVGDHTWLTLKAVAAAHHRSVKLAVPGPDVPSQATSSKALRLERSARRAKKNPVSRAVAERRRWHAIAKDWGRTTVRVKGAVADEGQKRVLWDGLREAHGSLHAGNRVCIAAVMCMTQESDCRSLEGGDLDSVGPFQQRTSWGSFTARRRAATSTRAFLLGGSGAGTFGWKHYFPMRDLPEGFNLGAAVQRVQVSAFPTLYAQWQPEATRTVEAWLRCVSAHT